MKGTRALVAAAAVLGLGATAEANPDFDRGTKLLENLEYKAAAEAFDKALERGANDPATTAAIYLRLGEIAASTGDTKESIGHFKRALSLDISLALPKGTSPKVGKPFADARRSIDDAISGTVAIDADAVAATLEIANDTLDMVAAASVTYVTGDRKTTAEIKVDGASTPIPLPARVTSLEIALIDRYENRLIELAPVAVGAGPKDDATSGAATGDGVDIIETRPEPSRPFITRWYLWGGLAVAAAAAGTGFGLSARSALDELDELKMSSSMVEGSEALAVEDKARSRALFANISFAAAGAFAIAATVFLFTGGDDPAETSGVSLAPSIGSDGVGVVTAVRW